MSNLHVSLLAVVLTFVAGATELSWGRGFGGFHGGMHMGGMRPGGLGGVRPGGVRPGGMRPGGLGGTRPSSFGRSNLGASGLGAPRLGGLPGASRPGSLGRFTGRPGAVGHGARGFPGGGARGFGAPGVRGKPGAGRVGKLPNRSQLGSFLGLPSDGGLHAVGQPRLGRGGRGLSRFPAADLRQSGDAVREGFRGRDLYSRGWYARYPGAWAAAGWGAGYAWRAATWDSLGSWFDYDDAEPVYYDYGNNITYQDNSVYVNGQDVGTAQQYYEQAQNLATTGAQADASADEQWMPLGIFAMSKAGHNSANMDFQLAVNKAGAIRGNYTNPVSNHVEPIHGSVDKKTQRAAWHVGKNENTVIETGIYNLTKAEAPALVHFGAKRTEQWILVRIKKDDQPADDSTTSEKDK